MRVRNLKENYQFHYFLSENLKFQPNGQIYGNYGLP